MANFDTAIKAILEHEGGFITDPLDPGGATNYGISYRFLKHNEIPIPDYDKDGALSAMDIKVMPLDTAKALYRKYFWDKNRIGEIVDDDIAAKVFDMSVNMGRNGIVVAQRAVNNRGWEPPLAEDGVMGPATLAALNTIPPHRLMKELKAEHALYYKIIVRNNPKLIRFARGWAKRAEWPETVA